MSRMPLALRLLLSTGSAEGRTKVLIATIASLQKYYFYLARCSDGSLYCGSCTNLHERENEHNAGKAAKYTRERRPVTIVYHEEYPTLLEARRRERQVKGWRRAKKEGLVLYGHPTEVS